MVEKNNLLFVTVLILYLATRTDSKQYNYVSPNEVTPEECPYRQCFSLSYYMERKTQFFVTGSSFIFLSGSHTIQVDFTLDTISDITLSGTDYSDVRIICNRSTISLQRVDGLTIRGLTFLLNTSKALHLSFCEQILISNSTFHGVTNHRTVSASALLVENSAITITNSCFEGNTGINGGALHASNAVITIANSRFYKNYASECGGAMYLLNSRVQLNGEYNIFEYNKCEREGGGIYMISEQYSAHGSSQLTSNTEYLKFSGNKAQSGGGIFAKLSTLTFGLGTNNHNSAENGGAVYFKSERHRNRLYTFTMMGKSRFVHNSVSGYKSAGGALYLNFARLNILKEFQF